MKGRYLIFEDGQLVHESNNAITSDGMHIIRTYLAGGIPEWGGAIAIGAANISAPSTSSSSLDFEFSRSPVTLKSVDSSEIILKSTISQSVSGKIFEIGVYPSVTNLASAGFDDRLVLNFDETWYDSVDVDTEITNYSSSSRIGSRSIILDSAAFYGKAFSSFDLSGYSAIDTLSLLYNVVSVGDDIVLTMTFEDDQLPTAGSREYSLTLDCSTTGYKIYTVAVGSGTDSGNFNEVVSSPVLEVSSSATTAEVNLDAVKINDADENNPLFALVSRSLIGSQGGNTVDDYYTKNAGVEIDIEYRLDIS